MIDYSLRNITAEELSFKHTPIQLPPNHRLSVNPRFSCHIAQAKDDPSVHVVVLECVIAGTEQAPLPYAITARFRGIFDVKNMTTEQDRRIFSLNAIETVFPYLRASLANLTADALVPPLHLPVVPGSTLFREEVIHFSPDSDSDTVN